MYGNKDEKIFKDEESIKISYIFGKTLVLSFICSACENEDENLFKEEKSIEILKILGLIRNI